jgi:hypothetical protein
MTEKITCYGLIPGVIENPCAYKFPILFELCEDKELTVKEFHRQKGVVRISGRRWKRRYYPHIWQTLVTVWSGGFGLNGKYTVKAMYDLLTENESGESYSRIQKAKFPYRIKIFWWLVENKAILTKDNMLKRKWAGIPHVDFVRTMRIFLICSSLSWPIARCVWDCSHMSRGTKYPFWYETILEMGG